MDSLLRPCPFCGGEAKFQTIGDELRILGVVKCAECGARMEFRGDKDAVSCEAVSAWNRRVGIAPITHEHWIKVQFADSKTLIGEGKLCLSDGFLCGHCGHDVYEKSPYCPHCGAKMDADA